MQTEAWSWLVSWGLMLTLGLLATLAMVGCAVGSGETRPAVWLATDPTPPPPEEARSGTAADDDLATQTRALAERLTATLPEGDRPIAEPDPIDGAFDPFAGAEPLPTTRPIPTPTSEPSEVAWLSADSPTPPATVGTDLPGGAFEVTPPPTVIARPEAPRPLTRAELLAELSAQLDAGNDPAMARAVTAAAVSLADPGHQLDGRVLEPLKPMQRDAVRRLHTLFLSIHRRAADGSIAADAAAGGGGFDRKDLDEALADAFGPMPLTIVHAELCRSVAGYGVYEPMKSRRFLAGRTQRTIVYVEVEDFAAARLDDDRREVRLEQELILYREDDGLAVWRHEPTQIVDVSRNHRRDFYVVQLITLPAHLGTGRYRLKVRLTDRHGEAIDETTLPLEVVADARLLDGDSVD
ncbi:MAG: hypothetical protein AAF800_04615 [Planctomycetota bacterium]